MGAGQSVRNDPKRQNAEELKPKKALSHGSLAGKRQCWTLNKCP